MRAEAAPRHGPARPAPPDDASERLDAGPTRSARALVLLVGSLLGLALALRVVAAPSGAQGPAPGPAGSVSGRGPSTEPPAPRPTVDGAARPGGPRTLWAPSPGDEHRRPRSTLPPGTLYARSSDTLYAIDLASGTTVVTPVPLATAHPVSMVALRDRVVLVPHDGAPGVVVVDGQPAAALPGPLRGADALLAGPPGHLWVLRQVVRVPAVFSATLVDERGRRDGPRFSSTGHHAPDGSGGLLVSDPAGVWQAHPAPLRRVTTGVVTAVGARHRLVLECDVRRSCTELLVDGGGDRLRALPGHDRTCGESVISPAGTHLASTCSDEQGPGARTTVERLSDHATLHVFPPPTGPSGQLGSLLWLSDRWLAVLTADRLTFYDSTHDRATEFALGDLRQLAWRPAGSGR